jgi:3-hydroxyisobutyrate dehydrogenase-like beta-hydroxyacid dehydrogenase
MTIAILGLGEAGGAIASGLLDKGFKVNGFDIRKVSITGVEIFSDLQRAVEDADYILSINSATVSTKILKDTLPLMKKGAVYVDFNTASPGLKRQLSEMMGNANFVDGAIMRPVSEFGANVPLIVAGPEAQDFVAVMSSHGVNVQFSGRNIGDAATRENLRNILLKGITSAVIDTLWVAQALGLEDWAITEIRREFDETSAQTLQGQIDRTQKNPKREQVDMSDIVSMLNDHGYESLMTAPIELILSHIIHAKRIPFAQGEN